MEAAILEFAPIIDVAVFGMPHPTLGEYLVAAVQATDAFSTVEFGRFLEQRLGPAKAPKRVVVLEKLPRNPTGKVLKRQLRDQLATRSADHRIELLEGAAEGRVRRIWSDALGGETDDRSASFMELGGTSLGALETSPEFEVSWVARSASGTSTTRMAWRSSRSGSNRLRRSP